LSNTQGSQSSSGDGSSDAQHPAAAQQAAQTAGACSAANIAVMFATADAGLLLQEYQDVQQAGSRGFLGVSAPHLLLHKKTLVNTPDAPPYSSNITRVPLLGFSGLGSVDDATRAALLDFNYLLAVGRLEEAFRAVAALRSPAVWRSMAHMAIKNKRLDVAGECMQGKGAGTGQGLRSGEPACLWLDAGTRMPQSNQCSCSRGLHIRQDTTLFTSLLHYVLHFPVSPHQSTA
jgi:hypothetical protein